jgi:hypothetical protein
MPLSYDYVKKLERRFDEIEEGIEEARRIEKAALSRTKAAEKELAALTGDDSCQLSSRLKSCQTLEPINHGRKSMKDDAQTSAGVRCANCGSAKHATSECDPDTQKRRVQKIVSKHAERHDDISKQLGLVSKGADSDLSRDDWYQMIDGFTNAVMKRIPSFTYARAQSMVLETPQGGLAYTMYNQSQPAPPPANATPVFKGDGPGSAYDRLDRLAKAIQENVSKSGHVITYAAAFAKALDLHPELYSLYLEEHATAE